MDSYLKFPAHWCIGESCKFVRGEMGIVRDVRFEFPRTVFFKFLSLILSQICLLGTSNMVDRNRSQGRLCRQRLLICKTLNQLMRWLVTVGPVMINCDQAGAKYRDHRSRSGARAAHSAEWAASAWPGPGPGAVGGVGGDSDSTPLFDYMLFTGAAAAHWSRYLSSQAGWALFF